jgi:hypothetical protein
MTSLFNAIRRQQIYVNALYLLLPYPLVDINGTAYVSGRPRESCWASSDKP